MNENELNLNNDMDCIIHKKIINYYCESCEEPICDDCTLLGPHNNNLHKINDIDIAYNARISKLGHMINGNWSVKREEINNILTDFDYQIKLLNKEKEEIIRDVKIE